MQSQFMLRIDKTLFEKIRVISDESSRSINKQLEFILKQYISDFEKTNGVISLEEE